MSDHFTQFLTKERERLTAEREALQAQYKDIEGKLATIDRETRALDIYEAARKGKRTNGTKRDTVLAIIREHQPIARGGIVAKLGDDKGLSNMLASLKKAGKVTAQDGKYAIAA